MRFTPRRRVVEQSSGDTIHNSASIQYCVPGMQYCVPGMPGRLSCRVSRAGPVNEWTVFIEGERNRYETHDGNRLAIGGANVSRYCEYLVVILGRYESASRALNANLLAFSASTSEKEVKSGTLDAEQMQRLAEGGRLSMLVHLEIEAFYVFAKVLLDRLADFVEMYFGKAHGISLASHDKLAKHLSGYAALKGLTLPPELDDTLLYLREHLIEFRDKQVTHQHNLRVLRGTGAAHEGATMLVTHLYPKPSDTDARSVRLHELSDAVNRYVDWVIELIALNRARTRLALKSSQSGA